jgi:hypothetical protein
LLAEGIGYQEGQAAGVVSTQPFWLFSFRSN